MRGFSNLELTLAALTVEAVIGYPGFVYRAIGHPVTWMGHLVDMLERRWNRPADEPATSRRLGSAALFILLASGAGVALAFEWVTRSGLLGTALNVLVASTLLAQRSLYEHVRNVADALETKGLPAARASVSLIVGRNPEALDEAGVARAALESLAENFSDGVVAPALWMAVAGLPGTVVYKAANTADSMIGHRTPRFQAFGWAAARFDDLVNLPASRLSAVFIAAAALLSGGSCPGALAAVRRDAEKHRSPNAGWPEAALAGALGLKLAGPRVYGDRLVEDASMGDGRIEATPADIRRGLRLIRLACAIQWALVLALCLIWRW